MKHIVAVSSCPTGVAHTFMAAEALKKAAALLGCGIRVETQGSAGVRDALAPQEIDAADAVILAADVRVDAARFAGKPLFETRTSEAIRHPQEVIAAALALAEPAALTAPAPAPAPDMVHPTATTLTGAPAAPAAANGSAPAPASKRLVGITSCPTGIAHTFMAAEALQKAARALGHEIKIETQGSVGAKNPLTPEDIAQADAVIIAADTNVDLARFAGKRLHAIGTKEAMRAGQNAIVTALAAPLPGEGSHGGGDSGSGSLAQSVEAAKAARTRGRTGPYKHLMTGVSYMLPVVIAGGLAIALAFALGGIDAGNKENAENADWIAKLAYALAQIGGGTAFHLFVAVLSGFIAYSIADRPGLAPGLVGGMLAQNMAAGFLGGIASGFLAGYLTKFLAEKIRLPNTLEGLKPVLILPFVSTISVGLLMIYVIAPPVHGINVALENWLKGMGSANAMLLGVVLGAMMAFDMGGPVNKAAYAFATGLLASKIYMPMAAVIAAGMTPPLGLALAAWLFRSRFDREEREAAGAAFVLGLSFITEGAIPFAAKDPLRVIPATMLGSATAGAISMAAGAQFLVPHGGVFAALIPGAVTPLGTYLLAIAAGSLATTGALFVLKRPVRAAAPEAAPAAGKTFATA